MDKYNYNILDEVIFLNATENNLSDTDPLNKEISLWDKIKLYKTYPTKYFLHEIFCMDKGNTEEYYTLEVYEGSLSFNLQITNENLVYTLLDISKKANLAADYAKYLLAKMQTNAKYIDWYNLVLDYELEKGYHPKDWDFDERKKYILEYEEMAISNNSSGFKREVILRAIHLGRISLFDRSLQQFSKYITYQGVAQTLGQLCANYGISYSYRHQEIGYLMQMQS